MQAKLLNHPVSDFWQENDWQEDEDNRSNRPGLNKQMQSQAAPACGSNRSMSSAPSGHCDPDRSSTSSASLHEHSSAWELKSKTIQAVRTLAINSSPGLIV